MSFIIGLKNLDLNISQDDLQRTSKQLDHHLVQAISDIHDHLRKQDEKIDYIINLLEERNGETVDI